MTLVRNWFLAGTGTHKTCAPTGEDGEILPSCTLSPFPVLPSRWQYAKAISSHHISGTSYTQMKMVQFPHPEECGRNLIRLNLIQWCWPKAILTFRLLDDLCITWAIASHYSCSSVPGGVPAGVSADDRICASQMMFLFGDRMRRKLPWNKVKITKFAIIGPTWRLMNAPDARPRQHLHTSGLMVHSSLWCDRQLRQLFMMCWFLTGEIRLKLLILQFCCSFSFHCSSSFLIRLSPPER